MRPVWVAVVAGVALVAGSIGTWLVSRAALFSDEDSVTVFCEVSALSAEIRGLREGVFVNGTDSGCVPSEMRFCIETRDSVLNLRRC
jgi:hypothetical protein